ncbi:hypothetical protein Mp_1g05820 [Marchantia polymorpha subsp. ruderalis]|uniref:Uncharacterized protein n=2 Tax=Marchantia polymorpha TaxID=3197 RepID=A0AAF6ALY0_MARPO|nr:hypothetical protein MARPO_0005s0026 [Marchantia polymorpha]BBM97450.1 hypothetical protein Mp_1g05820 [Marchantia polymorpha subsp. ruderalis]|eukprot:PTQ48354.1 hypothetical protein MARPO_0005s0026 [Marchantia polymorpha]
MRSTNVRKSDSTPTSTYVAGRDAVRRPVRRTSPPSIDRQTAHRTATWSDKDRPAGKQMENFESRGASSLPETESGAWTEPVVRRTRREGGSAREEGLFAGLPQKLPPPDERS